MGIIMRNNIAYSGGGGSESVELSMAEYEAREAAGAIDSDTWYLIYDANDSYNAKKIVYDNAESGMEASTVQGAIDELNSNLAGVSFVLNEDGTIAGYTSGGADTVHSFKKGVTAPSNNYLYYHGDMCYDKSGGWSGGATNISFSDIAYVYALTSGQATYSASFKHNKAVDLTNYTKLHIKGTLKAIGNYTKCTIALYNTSGTAVKTFKSGTTFNLTDPEFDISNVTGACIFKVSGSHVYSGNYIEISIEEMWLE